MALAQHPHPTACLLFDHEDKSQVTNKRNHVTLSLDVAIDPANIGKEAPGITPAPAVFVVTTILLTTTGESSIPSVNETFQAQA